MIRRPPRSTLSSSSAASDVYKRQVPVPAPAPHGPAQKQDLPERMDSHSDHLPAGGRVSRDLAGDDRPPAGRGPGRDDAARAQPRQAGIAAQERDTPPLPLHAHGRLGALLTRTAAALERG